MRIFQRSPSDTEVSRALSFLKGYPKSDRVVPEASDWLYGYGEWDEKAQRTASFTPILAFSGNIVKGSKVGDVDLSAMEISAEGGTVAQQKATIRRWTAPIAGTVKIYAELYHSNITKDDKKKPEGDKKEEAKAPEGDGVDCRIVSSSRGSLGTWSAFNTAVMTSLSDVAVKPGDTIDFVTVCGDDPEGDTFKWAPTITMEDRDIPGMKGMAMRWDARTNFMDPKKLPRPLGPWEEFAQVLLLSNEFATVD
jgi:hypothetical protein